MQEKLLGEYWSEARSIIEKKREKGSPQFPTGLSFLDELTGGINRGELWVLSGRTGMGKTALALNIARSCADNPENSILFMTLEQRGWELVLRMYCEMMGVNYSHLAQGRIELDETMAKSFEKYLSGIDFEMVEYGYTFEEIEQVIQSHYQTKKPDIIFIDFIQLIDYKDFNDQRLALVSYIRKIKELANKMEIAFVIVSQLRRLPSGADFLRPPDLQDLMGSGSIEQTADKCLFIYKEIEGAIGRYFIHLIKNRQGRTDKKEVIFKGECYKFEEIKESYDPMVEKVKDIFDAKEK